MKKVLCLLILLQCAVAVYGPGYKADRAELTELWLSSYARLSPENLKLAMEFNEIESIEIALAQSRLETGNYLSVLCTRYNNLFGMKKAAIRPTTATGSTENDYATYMSWYDSVKDLKLFQNWYRDRGRDLTDYFAFLKEIGYAEDGNYLAKLTELCTI